MDNYDKVLQQILTDEWRKNQDFFPFKRSLKLSQDLRRTRRYTTVIGKKIRKGRYIGILSLVGRCI